MDPIEIVAVALGLANLALLIRRSIWNFPVGIAMVCLYALIFWRVKLYSDAALQLFFFAANVYGWAAWARAGGAERAVTVERQSPGERLAWAGATLAATLAWGPAMDRLTDASLPLWDAAVAIPSVAAQLLLARRRIENWAYWIMVDALAVALYWTKGLALTAGLYLVFLVLAVLGLVEWRRAGRAPA